MPEKGTLLIVNHTHLFGSVEYEEAAQKSGLWDSTTLEVKGPKKLEDMEGVYDAILLLGLSGHQGTGFKLISQLKAWWPRALVYVVTHHGANEVFAACLTYGATRVFHSESAREVVEIISAIKKPPES